MNLNYSHSFKKEYRKLSRKSQNQFCDRVKIFQKNQFDPLLNNHAVHYPYEGCRSINITGDIRALYLEVSKNNYLFVTIGTHSKLYK